MKKCVMMAVVASGILLSSSVYADDEVSLSDSQTLGYAYMQDGTKVIKVSMNGDEPHDKDVELIRITEYGFYPLYTLSNKQENANALISCGLRGKVAEDHSENEKLACNSHFVGREMVSTALASTLTAGAAFFSFGTSTLATGLPDPKYFHKENFFDVIKKNNLQKYRTELLEINAKKQELIKYAEQKSQQLDGLYTRAFNDYSGNQENIAFNYKVNDKSGLMQNKNVDGGYSVVLNAPAKKSYTYMPLIAGEILSKENALVQITSIKEKIDQQYQKDAKEYAGYISGSFKNYKISGQSTKRFIHNDNIAFDATLKAPTEVAYTLGKKITIDVPIIVESANLRNMVPREYALNDANFQAIMKTDSDLAINGVLSNKTQSFITVKSLTGYYQSLVNNLSNLDKELAPESKDLDDGTRYALLSYNMKEKSNFSNITKSKAENTKINYGYAIKYKVNDTNIEKAIYNTKNYSLYEVYRQYL